MLTDDGVPHLMDFGLAKRTSGEVTVTLDGHILGTPAYMSPEQARGEGHKADRGADVYSLGAVLYQMITGSPPFRGTARMLMQQVQHDDPRPPRTVNPKVPGDLETICLKCLRKDARHRYATAKELADDLRRFLAGDPVLARPMRLWERTAHKVKRHRQLVTVAALSCVILVLTGLLAYVLVELFTPPVTSWTHGPVINRPADEKLTPLPPDLDLIPRDAFAFISLRPSDILQSEMAKRIGQFVKSFGVQEKELVEFRHDLEKEIGMELRTVLRGTVVWLKPPPFSAEFWNRVNHLGFGTTATFDPYDRVKVLAAYDVQHQEKEHHGKKYYDPQVPDKDFLHFVDNCVIVSAPTDAAMKTFLDRGPSSDSPGPMRAALSTAAEKHDFVAAVHFSSTAREAFKDWVSPDFHNFVKDTYVKPLFDAETAVLTVDLFASTGRVAYSDTLRVKLELTFPTEDSAKRGQEATRAYIESVRHIGREVVAFFGDNAESEKKALAFLKRIEDESPYAEQYLSLLIMGSFPEAKRFGFEFLSQVELALGTASAVQRHGNSVVFQISVRLDLDKLADLTMALYKAAIRQNLRIIGQAFRRYQFEHKRLPAAAIYGPEGTPLLSWRVLLLPYLGEDDLFKEFKLDEPWDSPHNQKLLERIPDVYLSENATIPYRVFTGSGTAFEGKQGLSLEQFTDGTKSTLLMVDAEEAVPWTKPDELAYDRDKPLPKLEGTFKDGFHALFADGTVRFLKKGISDETLRALITRNGGEPVDLDKVAPTSPSR